MNAKLGQNDNFCWCYTDDVHYECLFRGPVWNNFGRLCVSDMIKSGKPLQILTKLKRDVNNPKAVIILAKFYQHGCLGLSVNDAKALSLYQKAVKLGNSWAMNDLAYVYRYGRLGLSVDDAKALSLYQKAVKLGNSWAINGLAIVYENGGLGLAADSAKALSLYREAVKLGNSAAMYNLAIAYKNGQLGLAADDAKALPLYQKAAKLGNSWAISNLAHAYEIGQLGLAVDDAKALSLYRDAVKLGNFDITDDHIELMFKDDNLNKYADTWIDWMVANYGLLHEELSGKQSDQIGRILADNLDIHVLAEHMPRCLNKDTMWKIMQFHTNRLTYIISHTGIIFDVANIINNYA